MNTLRTMSEPTTWWKPIIDWLTENTIVLTSFALGWRGLGYAFKYLTEGRRAEIIQIIQQELNSRVTPEITKLTESIDNLKEAIWELKNK